jgi:hypothetical protein
MLFTVQGPLYFGISGIKSGIPLSKYAPPSFSAEQVLAMTAYWPKKRLQKAQAKILMPLLTFQCQRDNLLFVYVLYERGACHAPTIARHRESDFKGHHLSAEPFSGFGIPSVCGVWHNNANHPRQKSCEGGENRENQILLNLRQLKLQLACMQLFFRLS